jgi:hypothetical protein
MAIKTEKQEVEFNDAAAVKVYRPQRITLATTKSQIETTIKGLDGISSDYPSENKYLGQAIIYLKILQDLMDTPED